jgi:hypothetical protein
MHFFFNSSFHSFIINWAIWRLPSEAPQLPIYHPVKTRHIPNACSCQHMKQNYLGHSKLRCMGVPWNTGSAHSGVMAESHRQPALGPCPWSLRSRLGISMPHQPSVGPPCQRSVQLTTCVLLLLCLPGQEGSCG